MGLALSLAGWSGVALADPPLVRAKLTYDVEPGAEACPDERAVREQVALRLGYDPFHDDGAEQVRVRVSPRKSGLQASITTEPPNEPPASREIESEGSGCEELIRSVVLAVSLAIDPLRITRSPRLSVALAPAPMAQPDRTAVPASSGASEPAQHAPPKPAPWNVELGAAVRGGDSLLPGNGSLGPLVDLYVGKAGWAVLVEAGADLPTGHANNPNGVGSVSASLLRGGVGACALRKWFTVCAQVDAGELQGAGQGGGSNVNGLAGSSFYLDAAAAAGPNVRISENLRAQLLGNLVVPITHTSLGFPKADGAAATAWSSSPLAGLLSLGLIYRF